MSFVFWFILSIVACVVSMLFLKWLDRRNSVRMFNPRDSEREEGKKRPFFRPKVVEAKVKSLFPDHDSAEILRLLEDVASSWGVERMKLNVLKLSEGDLDQLYHYSKVAASDRDFIKVINQAEYPEFSRVDPNDINKLPYDQLRRLIKRDTKQYLNWIKKR